MPQYRTIAEFEAKATPTAAELALITACRAGEECTLGDGTRPETFTEARHIRADLLRLLITGGTTECGLADDGVWLKGAWITGELNLRFARARGRTALVACHFTDQPALTQARLKQLSLDSSHLPGLFAQGLAVKGSVFLSKLVSTQTVDFAATRIDGQLDCADAEFTGSLGKALNLQSGTVGESVMLNNLRTNGTVVLDGATIEGQLSCVGATFSGEFGRSDSPSPAFQAQSLLVKQGLFWRRVIVLKGRVEFNGSFARTLVDDLNCWPEAEDQLGLDGFTYDQIMSAPTDATSRLRWLKNGAVFEGALSPQPYTQLAKVLSDMGHERDARRVLLERETLLAHDQWAKDQTRYQALRNGGPAQKGDMGWQWLRMWSARLWSSLIRWTAGYGYAPERALYWTLGFVAVGWLVYFIAWQLGAMVPNSAIILTSADWADAMKINPITPAHEWTTLPTAAHYETFYALPYAADVFVPLVDLGQQSAWSQTTVTWSGWATRLFTWALQIAGWVITALGAAAVTGIIKRDRG